MNTLLDIHLLVVEVSAWGLYGIMRWVLLCSGVYGIITEISCSIAHLEAESTDLCLTDPQNMYPHTRATYDTLVNTTN